MVEPRTQYVFKKVVAIESRYFYFFPQDRLVSLNEAGLEFIRNSEMDIKWITDKLNSYGEGRRMNGRTLEDMDALLCRLCAGGNIDVMPVVFKLPKLTFDC